MKFFRFLYRLNNKTKGFLLIAVLCLLVLAAAAGGIHKVRSVEGFLEGTTLDGEDVSGQPVQGIISRVNDKLMNAQVELTEDGTTVLKGSLKDLVSKIGNAAAERAIYESAAEQDSYRSRDEMKKEQEGKPEKLLLTWFTREPALFEKLDGVISEADFTDEPYKTVAQWVFREYREKGKVIPANIVNTFEEIDEQREVAGILSTELYKPGEEGDISERERALNDIVKKIKIKAIDKAFATADAAVMTELIKQRSSLDKLYIKL